MGRTAIASGIAVIAFSLSAACGGRLFDVVNEGADAGAIDSLDDGMDAGSIGLLDAGMETGSLNGGMDTGSSFNLKCQGGDCAGEICCASVTVDPAGLSVASAASACSATPCAIGQYQLCASDSECIDAGCVENPLGAGPNVCARACTPGESQCGDGVQTCTARYQWATVPCTGDTPACLCLGETPEHMCMNAACVECTQGVSQCSRGMVQSCDPTGHWILTPCPNKMRCANGICV